MREGKDYPMSSKDESLVKLEKLFEGIVSIQGVAILVFNSELELVWINEIAEELAPASKDELIGKKMVDLVPNIEETDRHEKYLQTLKDGKTRFTSFVNEYIPGPKGTGLYEHLQISKVEDHLVLFAREIKEEVQLKTITDTLLSAYPAHVFVKNTDLEYIAVNDACATFHGFTKETIIGKTDYDLFPKDIADDIRKDDKRIIKENIIFENVERPLFNLKNDALWILATKAPLKDAYGKTIGLFGISTDITSMKTTESQLKLLSAAMHQTEDTIVVTDAEGTIQYVNPAFEKTTGYKMEDAIGKNPSILQSGTHSQKFYETLWKTITSGSTWTGHFTNKRADGKIYEENATISPVKNCDGEITNFVGVKRDVTKEMKLEAQLRQAQKMEAVGRLAGGIAHDFNNILTAILGYGGMVLTTLPKNDPNRKKVEEIVKAGKRAEALTRQLLMFSKQQMIRKEKLNVNSIIRKMRGLLRPITGESVNLKINLAKKLCPVFSDPGQIEQIVVNLLVNAKDALEGEKDGTIEISTAHHTQQDLFSDGNFVAHPGQYVQISVEDNGEGMDSDTLERIFEPFFSTKGTKGTGMGLATVYGIVKQHGGFITIASERKKGSVFKVFVPAIAGQARSFDSETGGGEEAEINFGEGKVLIVEDEEAVLSMAASILELAGYTVETALSGEEAVEKFNKNVDLILSDVVLEGMNGLELVTKLRKTNPDLKALFMSGYAGEVVEKIDLRLPENFFIAKPFTLEGLTLAVHDAVKADVGT